MSKKRAHWTLARLGAVMLMGGAVSAWAQTASVPLTGLAAAPQNGSLAAIDATWAVAGGTASNGWDTINAGGGVSYSHYNGANQLQTWTFNKPVDLSFIITGLNDRLEGVRLPAGTRCQIPVPPPAHNITFVSDVLRNNTTTDQQPAGAVQVTCQLHGVNALVLDGTSLGPPNNRRGLFALQISIPEITSAAPPAAGSVGTAYTHPVVATDSDPGDGVALSYAATGLPTGVSIDPATGVISGTPTTPGTYNVTVTASNGPVLSLPQLVTIVVAPAATVAVPTMEAWGLGALALALGGMGMRQTRRRRSLRK